MSAVTLMAAFALATAGMSAETNESWKYQDCPIRVVFQVPEEAGEVTVVSVSRSDTGTGDVNMAVCDSAGAELPAAVLEESDGRIDVAVQTGGEPAGADVHIYCGGVTGAPPARIPAADPNPVFLQLYSTEGRSVPDCWAKMLYLYRNAGRPSERAWLDGFGDFPVGREDELGRRRHRGARRGGAQRWIVKLSSLLRCPGDGTYRFAVDCVDAGFVLIDGQVVAEAPGEHDSGAWHVGPPVSLSRGLHRMDTLSFTPGDCCIHPAWVRVDGMPDQAAASIDDSLTVVTSAELPAAARSAWVRVERRESALHPAFTWSFGREYSFNGGTNIFLPVRFENVTACADGGQYGSLWTMDDGSTYDRRHPSHVFAGAGPHSVALAVTDSGQTARVERVVSMDLVQPVEYAVAGEVTGLPAVCYPRDSLAPVLRTRGAFPPQARDAGFHVRASLFLRSGAEIACGGAVEPGGSPAELALKRVCAGDLSRIAWTLSHAGHDVLNGTVEFVHPPFDRIPVRAEGDALYDEDGHRLVLVPDEYPRAGQQRPMRANSGVVLIDDTLMLSGRTDGGRAFREALAGQARIFGAQKVRDAGAAVMETSRNAYQPLVKIGALAGILAAYPDGVAALSVAYDDFRFRTEPAVFERYVAAMTEIVSVLPGRDLVWLTPPPYPAEAGDVRPYAMAIRRVADRRGIPVADIFSAFSGMQDYERLFLNQGSAELSAAGMNLAGQIVGEAVRGKRGAGRDKAE